MRGFHGIGVYNPKHTVNIGTLWRSAVLYDAAFVFTVGARYSHQASDTCSTPKHVPLYNYDTIDDLVRHLPFSCPLVGVELDPRAQPLSGFHHPQRAVYLLGAEDHGLPPGVVDRCHAVVQIESPQPFSMNVSTAGSLILYHRHMQPARSFASVSH